MESKADPHSYESQPVAGSILAAGLEFQRFRAKKTGSRYPCSLLKLHVAVGVAYASSVSRSAGIGLYIPGMYVGIVLAK